MYTKNSKGLRWFFSPLELKSFSVKVSSLVYEVKIGATEKLTLGWTNEQNYLLEVYTSIFIHISALPDGVVWWGATSTMTSTFPTLEIAHLFGKMKM